ncbi:hypothetical protein AX15_002849 [Amanita polypyramis BW_CC]|nr:hypothetical protein AX15_002849 [Amanita polypyramis BW_CC]
MPRVRPSKRLDSENEVLLPAWKPDVRDTDTVVISGRSFVSWTFGRGSVIYRIWLAVLLYTLFATAIAMTSINRVVYLGIPTVMMTVLGVVIGFVISYRASSGYDRYWMGKTGWEDVIKNSRTLGRLIWFHVPLRLSPKTAEEIETRRVQRSEKELNTAMAEKYMALDLTEGFSIALKHHLRGELGKHYEDLYHLIKPLHNHGHATSDRRTQRVLTAHSPAPYRRYLISAESAKSQLLSEPVLAPSSVPTSSPTHFKYMNRDWDPIIPPINAYGTFDPRRARVNPEVGSTRSSSRESLTSTSSSMTEDRSLLPANPSQSINRSLWGQVSGDLVPFSGLFNLVALKLGLRRSPSNHVVFPVSKRSFSTVQSLSNVNGEAGGTSTRPMRYTWHGPVHEGVSFKHRPRVAGGGQNLPLDILRRLSEWMSELEDRETVPGTRGRHFPIRIV